MAIVFEMKCLTLHEVTSIEFIVFLRRTVHPRILPLSIQITIIITLTYSVNRYTYLSLNCSINSPWHCEQVKSWNIIIYFNFRFLMIFYFLVIYEISTGPLVLSVRTDKLSCINICVIIILIIIIIIIKKGLCYSNTGLVFMASSIFSNKSNMGMTS